ncbi:tonB-system energizer ExbB [Methylobacterium sp. Leaf99]|uniref:tonB-system energizer ExbB n=1 Tax=Methylobacterium sp. Leaf99 TaxID=1736251 RepID=UPI000AE6D1D3|nr:tonB-system energizer ExbB [Methylobacterium sp. Leaf99]
MIVKQSLSVTSLMRGRPGRALGLALLVAVVPQLADAQQPGPAVAPVVQTAPSPAPAVPAAPAARPVALAEAAPAIQTTAPAIQTTAPVTHDLSPWSMFLNADILVKAIMVGLAAASVLTWTILLAKTVELGLARAGLSRALARIAGAGTLAEAMRDLSGRRSVVERFIAACLDEVRLSQGNRDAHRDGIKERAASRISEIVKAEGRSARRGMGALATIGSISPFVGLFGTVWGIMNSFIGISKAQTTNLAVVAPGIAEALLATAIGLVAAIPAVIIYNHFARATRGYGDLVQRGAGAALRMLSRDLERPAGERSGDPARHGAPLRAAG